MPKTVLLMPHLYYWEKCVASSSHKNQNDNDIAYVSTYSCKTWDNSDLTMIGDNYWQKKWRRGRESLLWQANF